MPGITHMALVSLEKAGILKFVISQVFFFPCLCDSIFLLLKLDYLKQCANSTWPMQGWLYFWWIKDISSYSFFLYSQRMQLKTYCVLVSYLHCHLSIAFWSNGVHELFGNFLNKKQLGYGFAEYDSSHFEPSIYPTKQKS